MEKVWQWSKEALAYGIDLWMQVYKAVYNFDYTENWEHIVAVSILTLFLLLIFITGRLREKGMKHKEWEEEHVKAGAYWFLKQELAKGKISKKCFRKYVGMWKLLSHFPHPVAVKRRIQYRLNNGDYKPIKFPKERRSFTEMMRGLKK